MSFIDDFVLARQELISGTRRFISSLNVNPKEASFVLRVHKNDYGWAELEEDAKFGGYCKMVYQGSLKGAIVEIPNFGEYLPLITHFEVAETQIGRMYFTGKLNANSVERVQNRIVAFTAELAKLRERLASSVHPKAIESLNEKIIAAQNDLDYFRYIAAYLD